MNKENPLDKYKNIEEDDVVENVDGMPFPKEKNIEHFNKEDLKTIDSDIVEEKVKEPKPPKEKKVKEPKPPKEKKIKEPKPPKEKKIKEPKPPKEKKIKEPKPPKEKKVKEPKPPKEKKVKEPKPPKEKKAKKAKEPMTKRDWATVIAMVLAAICASLLILFKFFPDVFVKAPSGGGNNPVKDITPTVDSIEILRKGTGTNTLVAADIPNIYFGITSDGEVNYYRIDKNFVNEISATGKIDTSIDLGNQTIPVTINYVETEAGKFGMGLFRADQNENIYFYDTMIFKLTELPKEYKEENKVLLLATTNQNAMTQKDVIWTESFVLNMADGTVKRFLSDINRTLNDKGAGVDTFCMINSAGYTSQTTKIPFISSRQYGPDENKKDVFIKEGKKETLLGTNIFGKYLLYDNESVVYFQRDEGSFNVVKNKDGKEEIVTKLYGPSADYFVIDNYILNKTDGRLINLFTGEEKILMGYKMAPELAKISPDGKYLVTIGTVKSVLDYRIYIFNLETGDYYEYKEKNLTIHSNLEFVDNTTVVFSAADPETSSETVLIDLTKLK